MRKALVIGSAGQDGTYLTDLLRSKEYDVTGVRRPGTSARGPWEVGVDVRDRAGMAELVQRVGAEEIYYLAAHHQSSQGKERRGVLEALDVNLTAYANVLEAAAGLPRPPRVFYACSSLIYGSGAEGTIDERSKQAPDCAYGIAKQAGLALSERYRVWARLHVSVGILFNHESVLRPAGYLPQRIVSGVKAVAAGTQREIVVGDARAQCDWGFAGDFVEAMWRMVQLEEPGTFVVATGELHSVSEWIQVCCELAGLDALRIVVEDPSLLTRRKPALVGDSARLRAATGWTPTLPFREMARRIYEGRL